MTEQFEATLATPLDSPELAVSESELPDGPIPQGLVDIASRFLNNDSPETPVKQEQPETVEDSVEDEQVSTEDTDESIEAEPDTDDEVELSDDSGPDSIVEYSELKNHTLQFKVGGEIREMTIDQIASELGQVKAASKARSEVDTEKQLLQQKRNAIEAEQDLLRRQQGAAVESQKVSTLAAEIQQYQHALNHARQNQDFQSMVQLKDAIDVKTNELRTTQDAVRRVQDEADERLVEEQSARLNEMGFGALMTDTQRRTSLSNYAQDNLSATDMQAVNFSAPLLAIVEKARLYDQAKSKSGKLKPSGTKTLKSGGSKVSKPKRQMTSDEGLTAIANRLLGTQS